MPRKFERVRVEPNLYQAGEVFYACATPAGSRQARWKTLGPVGIMAARRMRDEFVGQVRAGQVPTASRARVTFDEVADEWLDQRRQLLAVGELRARTLESDETSVRLHLRPELGRRAIRSIEPRDLAEWVEGQRLTGAAPWSIRARWSALNGVLNLAVRRGYITANPSAALTRRERPKAGEARVRFLDRDEIARLLKHTPPSYRAAIATGVFSGLRIAELLGLVWADIDFAEEVVRVRFQMTRAGDRERLKTAASTRDVILMPALAAVLRQHRLASPRSQDSDLVFVTATGRTIGARNLSGRGLEKATDAAGLADVTFHTLRHTFASILIDQGRDVPFVSEQLGHTDPAFTLRTYVHLFNAARQRQEARDQLDAEYGDLLRRAE